MIEAAPSVRYWIMDSLFSLQSTVRSMQNKMLQLSKEKYFIFQ